MGQVRFADVNVENVHASDIDALYTAGITRGCSTSPLRFCPDAPVTRAQMATFLVRALVLEDGVSVGFTDVNVENVHASDIDALYTAGITRGCSTSPLRFCPDAPVTRAQMATFLVRALVLEDGVSVGFTDVNVENVHASDIDALYTAGITRGCSTSPLRFCPDAPVTRAQMATFLIRSLGLQNTRPTQ